MMRDQQQRRHQRQRDPRERVPAAGAVDRRRLVQMLRDGRQPGQPQQHHERRPHPDVGDRHGVERHIGIGQPGEIAEAEDVVDDAPGRAVEQLPEQADHGHRHHHRQQQQRREQALEGDLAVEQQRHAEADQHLAADRHQHVFRRDAEVVPDVVVGQQIAVVLQADEGRRRVGRGAEIGERVAERIDQRKDVEDDQERNRRDDEQIADREIA